MATATIANGMAQATMDNGMAPATMDNGMVVPADGTPNTTRKVPRWDLMELPPADNGNEMAPANVLSPRPMAPQMAPPPNIRAPPPNHCSCVQGLVHPWWTKAGLVWQDASGGQEVARRP